MPRNGGELAWGAGYYQAGEVLMRRRPSDTRSVVDLSSVAHQLNTDVLLGHIRRPTTGALRTENTHPFRYQQWLFAHDGELGAFKDCRTELLNAQPDFLRRSIRGNTDSEVLFYTILSELHRAGALTREHPGTVEVVKALRASIERVGSAISGAGGGPDRTDFVMTDGERVYVVHRSNTIALLELMDDSDVGQLLFGDSIQDVPLPSLDNVRATMIVSGVSAIPGGWRRLESGSIAILSRTVSAEFQNL